MGERLSDEEMEEFLGWLGLRDGGSINLVNFKKLPCWQPEEAATAGSPKRGGMLSHFSKVPRRPAHRPVPHRTALGALRALFVAATSWLRFAPALCKPLRKPLRKPPANPCANPCAIL
jgi:hypothetical protein